MELLAMLLMVMILFKVFTYWQGVIIDARFEAGSRLQALCTVQTVAERLLLETKLPEQGRFDEGDIHISWHQEPLIVPDLNNYIPCAQQPTDLFHLISMNVSWRGAHALARKTSFLAAGGLS